MIPEKQTKDWKELARRAANEQDPKKLLAIIDELNAALEERESQLRGRIVRPAAPVHAAEQNGRKILFVDDEPNIRLTLPLLLQQRGFDVQSAASIAEALAAMKAGHFDILLSDINVSEDGDGFTVVRAMREANPDCVTILLTGYPGFETALEAIHNEVDDYVVKPVDLDALVKTMQRKLLTRNSRHSQDGDASAP
jgi:ActR/RegA family two-component response regulator